MSTDDNSSSRRSLPPISHLQPFYPHNHPSSTHVPFSPPRHTPAVPAPSTSVLGTHPVDSDQEHDTHNEPGSPPKKKRRRQALSCTECKRRKIKCDRSQPCGPCTRRNEQDKCQWHVVEPVDKYVTRTEWEEWLSRQHAMEDRQITLEQRCKRLEQLVQELSYRVYAVESPVMPSQIASSSQETPRLGSSRRLAGPGVPAYHSPVTQIVPANHPSRILASPHSRHLDQPSPPIASLRPPKLQFGSQSSPYPSPYHPSSLPDPSGTSPAGSSLAHRGRSDSGVSPLDRNPSPITNHASKEVRPVSRASVTPMSPRSSVRHGVSSPPPPSRSSRLPGADMSPRAVHAPPKHGFSHGGLGYGDTSSQPPDSREARVGRRMNPSAHKRSHPQD